MWVIWKSFFVFLFPQPPVKRWLVSQTAPKVAIVSMRFHSNPLRPNSICIYSTVYVWHAQKGWSYCRYVFRQGCRRVILSHNNTWTPLTANMIRLLDRFGIHSRTWWFSLQSFLKHYKTLSKTIDMIACLGSNQRQSLAEGGPPSTSEKRLCH